MSKTLTASDAVDLGTIVGWAISTKRVVWIDDHSGDLRHGTVRAVGDERGNRLNNDEDIRDGFLRVTTDSGMEQFFPMAEVMEKHRSGTFMEDRK